MSSIFKHCPNCTSQDFVFHNNHKFSCNNCGFEYYHNVAAAVAIVFIFQGKILFTERNVAPDKGKLDLPGGFIDGNENAEMAACREIQEELGIIIKPQDLIYITTSPNDYYYKNVLYQTMDVFYQCELSTNAVYINAQDEIKNLLWLAPNEIDLEKIAFKSIKKVIKERFLN